MQYGESTRLASKVNTDRYLYVGYRFCGKQDDTQSRLLVFDLTQVSTVTVVQELPLERHTLLTLKDRPLTAFWPAGNERWRLAEFDADKPATLTESDRWTGRSDTVPFELFRCCNLAYTNQFDTTTGPMILDAIDAVGTRSGGAPWYRLHAIWRKTRQVALLSDALGLRVAQQTDFGR